MLQALRKGTKTWVAAVFIGLLVLSFAVWGIADIFGGYGTRTIAKVGDHDVTADEFQIAYRNEVQRVSNQFRRPVTPDMARALGIEQRVLARLVNSAAIDTHARKLGLGVADQTVISSIQRDENFHGSNGQFNQLRFQQLLAQAGLSEAAYANDVREALLRQQIAGALTEDLKAPEAFVDANVSYRNEARQIDFLTLPLDQSGEVPAPDDAALKAFYDENPQTFTAPEFRQLVVLNVTADTVKDTIEILPAEILQDYEANIGRYTTEESRHVQQISFPNEDAAAKALVAIRGGQDFVEAAKAAGQTETDIDLGQVVQTAMADQKVAKAAFALEDGAVSEPIKGTFRTVLVKVSDIKPKVVRTMEEVSDEIRDHLVQDRASTAVADLYDAIEDDRAGGMTFAEIGAKHNIPVRTIDKIDSQGNGPDGQPIADLPAQQQLLREAFSTEVGVEANAIESGGGFVWFNVLAVTPATLKPFEAVKDEVAAATLQQRRLDALRDRSNELLAEANTGKSLADLAKELGLEVKQSGNVTRSGGADGLPPAAISQAFALGVGGHGVAWTDARDGRVLFELTKIEAAATPSDADKKALEEQISSQMLDDLLSQYTSALRTEFNVEINQAAVDYATGRTPQPAQGRGGGGMF